MKFITYNLTFNYALIRDGKEQNNTTTTTPKKKRYKGVCIWCDGGGHPIGYTQFSRWHHKMKYDRKTRWSYQVSLFYRFSILKRASFFFIFREYCLSQTRVRRKEKFYNPSNMPPPQLLPISYSLFSPDLLFFFLEWGQFMMLFLITISCFW